jgi:hypothetical protein
LRIIRRQVQNFRFLLCSTILTVIVVCTTLRVAPAVLAQARDSNAVPILQSPDALVREVIRNEIKAQLHDQSLWCHSEQQQEDGKPAKTLQVCQTQEGDLERLVALSGTELTSLQAQAEDQRIQRLVSHPEQLRAKQKKEREDGEQARNLLVTLPDAFLFQCDHESGNLVTLRFRPNPAFRPSTRSTQVFHHMEGTLVVDADQKRLVEINGRLTSEVRFLGGLLGHLDKDGTFCVRQQQVGEGHWDLSFMNIQMNGKALFFKTINVSETKSLIDYKPLPSGATLQQAADFLRRDFDIHTASTIGK